MYSVANETGNRIRILKRCKFRYFGLGIDFIRSRTITYAILYHFHKTLRRARKRGRLDARCFWDKPEVDVHVVLEVCEFRFWQFPNCACHVFPRIVTKNWNKFKANLHWLYLEYQRNRKQKLILEMCKIHGRMPILTVLRLHLIDPSSIEHNSVCNFSKPNNLF